MPPETDKPSKIPYKKLDEPKNFGTSTKKHSADTKSNG
jgi:hypothetical protein